MEASCRESLWRLERVVTVTDTMVVTHHPALGAVRVVMAATPDRADMQCPPVAMAATATAVIATTDSPPLHMVPVAIGQHTQLLAVDPSCSNILILGVI